MNCLRPIFLVPLFLLAAAMSVSFTGEHSAFIISSRDANKFFWDQLHQGNYDSISSIIRKLEAVYEENPKDFISTAHLGFANMWEFCERGRKDPDSARVVSYIFASNMYFKRAIRLNPYDSRLRGFQSATDVCTGALSRNPLLVLRGFANGKKAIRRWSQFNKSSLSFVQSQLDSGSFLYDRAIRYQWEVIDECSCKALDRKIIMADPQLILGELATELRNSRDSRITRACWNSWIAPHNLEGFMLNFGDMLVKQGDRKTAIAFYRAAALSPTYSDWPFKATIEERLRNTEKNEELFNRDMRLMYSKGEKQIFINSTISCVGCHQMGKDEFTRTPFEEPPAEYYFNSN